MTNYKKLKEKFKSGNYEDLTEDLNLELQMYGMYESIDQMVKDDNVNGGSQDIARAMCEDFPDRYCF